MKNKHTNKEIVHVFGKAFLLRMHFKSGAKRPHLILNPQFLLLHPSCQAF